MPEESKGQNESTISKVEKPSGHKPTEKPRPGSNEDVLSKKLIDKSDPDTAIRRILGLKPESVEITDKSSSKPTESLKNKQPIDTEDAKQKETGRIDKSQEAKAETDKQPPPPEATKALSPAELKRNAILEKLDPQEREKFLDLSAKIGSLELPKGTSRYGTASMTETQLAQHDKEMRLMNEAISEIRSLFKNEPLKKLAMEDLSRRISGPPELERDEQDKNGKKRDTLRRKIVQMNVEDAVDGVKIDGGSKRQSDNPAKMLSNLGDNLSRGHSLASAAEAGKHANEKYSSLIKPGFIKRFYRDAKDLFSGNEAIREEQKENTLNDIVEQKQLLEGALMQSIVSHDKKPYKGKLFQSAGEDKVPYKIAAALARFSREDPTSPMNKYNELVYAIR